MSTVRSIERRLYVRRQADRDIASQVAVAGGEVPRHMEWNGVWAGYMMFVGVGILLLSLVFGIGFSSLNPLNASSWRAVGGGTMGWAVVALLISTFLGAWVAGRTPRTTKRHGMMRGVTLWGMIMLTCVLAIGWVAGTAVSAAGSVASSVAPAVTSNGANVQAVLQRNGITITNAQATSIANQLTAGDQNAAAAALAADAGIPVARASSLLGEVNTPMAGAAQGAGTATKNVGGNLSWGLFWISLIGLGVALLGGSAGGGGVSLRRPNRPTNQPA
jgi:hypothetical protein